MSDLLQEFRAHWSVTFPALQGSSILLAVSGGIDSMVLANLFRNSGIAFGVAHCNFGLRGGESDLDEALVRSWCTENNVPFHSVRFETKKKSAEWKKGTQETARKLRYDWFEQVRKEGGYARIATAHHANDNVETLLMNLFRGTGIQGLHGILPERGNIIRPFLFANRLQIAAYCAAEHVPYREDASNSSDDYLRNAIRHHVVPAAEQLFPDMVGQVNQSIKRFGEAEELYNSAIASERKQLIEQRGKDHYIPVRKLIKRSPLATICYELLLPFGFHSSQLTDVLSLLTAETGRYVSSATHRVIRNRDFLIITTLSTEETDLIQIEENTAVVDTTDFVYSFAIAHKPSEIPSDSDKAFLDLDAVGFPLVLRKWRIGDYLYPLGMGMKKKKVSRILIDAKVPVHEKERVWVLECNKRIVWVCGMRLDERFRVKSATQKVLVVTRKPR